MEGKIKMGDMKEKEALTRNEYSMIYEKLMHLEATCEELYEKCRFNLKDKHKDKIEDKLKDIEQIRDTVDEFEQIMGTNYKGEYKANLECIDIFKKRDENKEPNDASWPGYERKFRFCS